MATFKINSQDGLWLWLWFVHSFKRWTNSEKFQSINGSMWICQLTMHIMCTVHAINNILLAVWLYTGKLRNSYSIIVFGRFGLSKPQKSLQMAIKQCANHTIVSLTIKLLWLQTTLSVLELSWCVKPWIRAFSTICTFMEWLQHTFELLAHKNNICNVGNCNRKYNNGNSKRTPNTNTSNQTVWWAFQMLNANKLIFAGVRAISFDSIWLFFFYLWRNSISDFSGFFVIEWAN